MLKITVFSILVSLTQAQWGANQKPPCVSCGNHFVKGTEKEHQIEAHPYELMYEQV